MTGHRSRRLAALAAALLLLAGCADGETEPEAVGSPSVDAAATPVPSVEASADASMPPVDGSGGDEAADGDGATPEATTAPGGDAEPDQADAEPEPAASQTPAPEPTETPAPEPEAEPEPEVVVHSSQVPPLHPSVDSYPRTVVELVADDGTVHRLAVLVADTQPRRSHGLMEVPDVPAGTGMLFTFDVDRTGGFWMKGTLTDLQIAWADVGGTVVATERMTVCVADPCPSYPPGATYRSALEVRDGWLDEIGVGVGAQLRVVAPIVPAT